MAGSAAVRWEQEEGPPDRARDAIHHSTESVLVRAVMAQLHTDPDRRAALDAEVRASGVVLPEWLSTLPTARVFEVVEIRGDWLLDTFAIELWASGTAPMTVVVRIDHRLGTLVSDAEVMGTDVATVLRATTFGGGEHPGFMSSVAPKEVRAKLERALAAPRPPLGVGPGAGWEPLRPLLVWLAGQMPASEGYDDEYLDEVHSHARSTSGDGPERTQRPPRRRRYHDRIDPDACEQLELRQRYGMKSKRFGSQLLHEVTQLVGGPDVLAALDDEPLPDDPFDATDVPADIAPLVAEVLDLCDRACDQFFDVEVRTATRRLLHRAATDGADAFRRKGSVHTAAAALVWVVASRNHLLGKYAVQAKELTQSLAVSGTPSSRATGLLRAIGLDTDATAPEFGAEFLTGARRAQMATLRDILVRQPVYRLRVTLDGIEPPIERTFELLGEETFGHLHDVLQVAFGWDDCHLAQFELDGQLVSRTEEDPDPWGYGSGRRGSRSWYDEPDELDDDDDAPMGEMNSLIVAPVLERPGTLRYRYDLGDDWVHTITVESRTTLGETVGLLPRLVSATRATPPDDLGGVGAYRRVLETLGTIDEGQARDLCAGVRTPVRPGTFDPYRPDAEQAQFDAISAAMRGLAI